MKLEVNVICAEILLKSSPITQTCDVSWRRGRRSHRASCEVGTLFPPELNLLHVFFFFSWSFCQFELLQICFYFEGLRAGSVALELDWKPSSWWSHVQEQCDKHMINLCVPDLFCYRCGELGHVARDCERTEDGEDTPVSHLSNWRCPQVQTPVRPFETNSSAQPDIFSFPHHLRYPQCNWTVDCLVVDWCVMLAVANICEPRSECKKSW